MQKIESQWKTIQEFPNYEVDQMGQIFNTRTQTLMRTSQNNHGHEKITLTAWDGTRHTRSVALLVATAFIEPPTPLCDTVMVLDGNRSNIYVGNLAWRPRWFAWKYTRQLKTEQPIQYRNLHVLNINENVEYRNIIQAGMVEGLLFDDIWRSTYTGAKVFPHGHRYEISERV